MLKKQIGYSPSLTKAILKGTSTAFVCAFLLAAVTAKLVDAEIMPMEKIGYCILAAHLISVMLGSTTAISGVGKGAVPAAALTGAGYYASLLLVNGLFFGGSFSGLGVTLILVAVGTMLPIFLICKRGTGKVHRRYKIPGS